VKNTDADRQPKAQFARVAHESVIGLIKAYQRERLICLLAPRLLVTVHRSKQAEHQSACQRSELIAKQ